MTVRIFNVKKSNIEAVGPCYAMIGAEIKKSVDLRNTDSYVDDQGMLGSCSANALVNVYENMVLRSNPENFKDLSRLFLYYNSRILEETVEFDAGVMELKSTLDSAKHFGICTEEIWPYDISMFTVKPSDEAYVDALTRRILRYEYIDNDDAMIEILSLYSKPIIIGMYVFSSFMSANKKRPIISMPVDSEVSLGGHAVSVVGYTADRDFIIKNSFGAEWGSYGYAILSKEYTERYVFDRWHIAISEFV
jgi:C1A family cysteine protease